MSSNATSDDEIQVEDTNIEEDDLYNGITESSGNKTKLDLEPVVAAPVQLFEDNHELKTSYRILSEIMRQNKTTCWPFLDEVDAKALGLWDYGLKIKEPMWLNKMVEKFNDNLYSSIAEFATDFRTMVENCYRYNGTDHVISKKARRLEMIFEGKIALLKSELKNKASLQATSKGRFAIDMADDPANLPPTSRSGRIGNSRDSVLNDSSVKLVYDFVKCEETMCLEDEKKSNYRERRNQEMLYQRIAASWINTLEFSPDALLIKTCPALPEIGFFLHLTESLLKFPELNMYTLERCVLVPEYSSYLAKIMTCLLCTYQERSQITQRPPMHFLTWNKRLKERMNKWFEVAQKYKSYFSASEKFGFNVKFFEAMQWKNPFVNSTKKTSYADLTFNQKVEIIKALCDAMLLLQSVQNALQSLDPMQLQCMYLGKDCHGNIYVYFPQFCGDDVRIYRHREYGEPTLNEIPEVMLDMMNEPESANDNSNDKTDSTTNEAVNIDTLTSVSNNEMNSVEKSIDVSEMKENGIAELEQKEKLLKSEAVNMDASTSVSNNEIIKVEKSFNVSETRENGITELEREEKPMKSESSDSISTDIKEYLDELLNSLPNGETVVKNEVIQGKDDRDNAAMDIAKDCTDEVIPDKPPTTPQTSTNTRTPRQRKRNPKYDNSPSKPSTPRSLRKRNAVNYNNLSKAVTPNEPTPKKKRAVSCRKKAIKVVEEKYGNVEFEMLCDNVESIPNLISELEVLLAKEIATKKIETTKKEQTEELITKLKWLHEELNPWSAKLEKAKLSAQIQMKREHDRIQHSMHKLQSDQWLEELTNKNTFMQGDNLTISHASVNSPASSVASYNDDSSDEDYVHPYFTRKTTAAATPAEQEIDETLYIEEKKHLLGAALWELEYVLQENAKEVVKMTDRTQLCDSGGIRDGRYTRQKRKKQNKILGKILKFAEEKTSLRPTLLPLLYPDYQVLEKVDTLLMQEESRLFKIANERREKNFLKKKMKGYSLPTSKLAVDDIKNKLANQMQANKNNVNKNKVPEPITIKMSNGKIYHATRLGNGSVVPISRLPGASCASSVQELIENTNKEIRRKIKSNIPHISLGSKPSSAQNHTESVKVAEPNQEVSQEISSKNIPDPRTSKSPSKIHSSLSLGTVTVRQSPQKAVNLPVSNQQHAVIRNQFGPGIRFVQQNVQYFKQSQANSILLPTLSQPSYSNPAAPQKPVTINGAQYGVVNVVQPSQFSKSSIFPINQQQTAPTILLAPSSQFIVRPVLTPVQIVTSQVKYQSNPSPIVCNNDGNNVILLQNGTNAGVNPVQFVTPVVTMVTPNPSQQQVIIANNEKQ